MQYYKINREKIGTMGLEEQWHDENLIVYITEQYNPETYTGDREAVYIKDKDNNIARTTVVFKRLLISYYYRKL